jgi:hypothetical protein
METDCIWGLSLCVCTLERGTKEGVGGAQRGGQACAFVCLPLSACVLCRCSFVGGKNRKRVSLCVRCAFVSCCACVCM